ncbi:hypothetical protein FA15DRAFT_250927 [Coprinopsis marcescibilis]|uniref:Mitochondrial K+-H+ exchange-related-domain-containing protein n=1 Tax=Coprinopsis marcescibilis TaxID=230819 RepID=A0A5C3L2Q4_COPMA|nr:hypothetical protein FA15DRAFT_250927 [Coprinopsis marcescibilis]
MSTAVGVASVGLRRARIIAIPLVRPDVKAKALTYYQFQLSSQKEKKTAPTTVTEKPGVPESTEPTPKQRWALPEEGVSTWVQTKAGNLWASFGKAEGGWKLKVFQTGERLMDRLDFEELALKSVDPSLGPTIAHPTTNEVTGKGGAPPFKIPLLYPSSITQGDAALAHLRQYADHRTPIHRRGFLTWLIIAPITAPFMIIPVIPNLPFFFCVWRSWSHYRAYRSSQYLQSLLDQQLIVPEPSAVLDAIYKEHPDSPFRTPPPPTSEKATPLPSTSPSSPKVGDPSSLKTTPLLLSKSAVPAILERFELAQQTSADLYRAFEQARVRTSDPDASS